MKTTALLCIPLALLLVSCGGGSGDETTPAGDATADAKVAPASSGSDAASGDAAGEGARPFKVKSGIIESTLDLMGEQKQMTYFDDYGAKQSVVLTMDIMGTKSEKVTINADGWAIEYDPATKTGTKMRMMTPAGGIAGVPSIDALSESMKERYKFKEIESRTIAGKEAKGFQMEAMGMPVKAWTWEGIPLRAEVEMGKGKPMVTEVKKLEVDVPVPAERFAVPADVKLTEIGK